MPTFENMAFEECFQRLPTSVLPTHYDLWLRPNVLQCQFQGSIKVNLDVTACTDVITCHADQLEISEVQVNNEDVKEAILLPKKQTLTLKLEQKLEAGTKACLTCKFSGVIYKSMVGFYKTVLSTGQTAVTTHFESGNARKAFPCWDEPAFKSTFSIRISGPKHLAILSNMPQIDEADDDDHEHSANKICTFGKTPLMSTYLVAFVIGPLEAIEVGAKDGTLVRIWTPIGKSHQGQFALEVSKRALEFLTDLFGIAYALPKYDSVSIPDFEMVAMENWGLALFRDSAILVDALHSSVATKQYVAKIIAHEAAHVWFGNLVTMQWWNDLWLKEGFAEYFETACPAALYPDYNLWSQFVMVEMAPALLLDALNHSHPIDHQVGYGNEVTEMFDCISYNKGACILRMLAHYIGEEEFRLGLREFLSLHSYGTTKTVDLWNSLGKSSGKPLESIMSAWTAQKGFPVVTVTSQIIGAKLTLTMRQEKFNADGSDPDASLWQIPIEVVTSNGKMTAVLMDSKEISISLEHNDIKWFKVNPGSFGFYRVFYTNPDDLLKIKEEFMALAEIDRFAVLDDLCAFAMAGKVQTTEILEFFMDSKGTETSFIVWSCMLNFLSKIESIVSDDADWKAFVVLLLEDVHHKLGWISHPSEDHSRTLLRPLILSWMGCCGHQPTIFEAQKRFLKHSNNSELIPVDLRASVYKIVAANGGMEVFDQLVNLLKKSDFEEERERLNKGLGSFSDPFLVGKVLNLTLTDLIRSHDAPNVIENVSNKDLAWDFFKKHYDTFNHKYHSLLAKICQAVTEDFASTQKAADIEAFFEANFCKIDMTVKQQLEKININAKWKISQGKSIEEFFKLEVNRK